MLRWLRKTQELQQCVEPLIKLDTRDWDYGASTTGETLGFFSRCYMEVCPGKLQAAGECNPTERLSLFGTIDEAVTVDSGATVMELPKPIAPCVLDIELQDLIFTSCISVPFGHTLLYCDIIHPFYNGNVYPGPLFFWHCSSLQDLTVESCLKSQERPMLRHFNSVGFVRTTRAH